MDTPARGPAPGRGEGAEAGMDGAAAWGIRELSREGLEAELGSMDAWSARHRQRAIDALCAFACLGAAA